MTHARLVDLAVAWLRRYRCGIVLAEQSCSTGERPDAIGWKGACRSVVVECKLTRADFVADALKPWRRDPQMAMGCERYYLAPAGMIRCAELRAGWGLLEVRGRKVQVVQKCSPRKSLRSPQGLLTEMNLLLASLRRVEVRIEPQTITDFLKWKNRLAEYNGGAVPQGIAPEQAEDNPHLHVPAELM